MPVVVTFKQYNTATIPRCSALVEKDWTLHVVSVDTLTVVETFRPNRWWKVSGTGINGEVVNPLTCGTREDNV